MYRGVTDARCGGEAKSAMGPFYCPADQKVYLDTSFFNEIENRFHGCEGKACQFSQAYVIAHEVGHHVQNLLGILPKVQSTQRGMERTQANHLQVQVELQADCFAGIWANHENQRQKERGRPPFVEQSDVDAALQDRGRDRRRHAAEEGDRPGGARRLHARLERAAPALVLHRLPPGHRRRLRHLQGGAAVRHGAAAPSPPSGGEGRDEGVSPRVADSRLWSTPHPDPLARKGGERERGRRRKRP